MNQFSYVHIFSVGWILECVSVVRYKTHHQLGGWSWCESFLLFKRLISSWNALQTVSTNIIQTLNRNCLSLNANQGLWNTINNKNCTWISFFTRRINQKVLKKIKTSRIFCSIHAKLRYFCPIYLRFMCYKYVFALA